MPDFELLDSKEGQSGGTKSPERGPFPSRKTDPLPDLRSLQDQRCSGEGRKHERLA